MHAGRHLPAAAALAIVALAPALAEAYVGPGAGFAFVTSFFLLLSTALLTFLTLLSWPLRALWRVLRTRRPPRKPQVDRVVIVGLDGLDPQVTRELMERGKLPSFKRLADRGWFGELGTTCPAMSPVAWSSFATGVDPSRHGIFDFLTRDTLDYTPVLSSAELGPPRRQLELGGYRLPLGKPSVRGLRRGVPFWNVLGQHGVRSCVLRVPLTFPPDRPRHGTLLSGMCVPDLLGTQGTYTFITSRPPPAEQRLAGRLVTVELDGGEARAQLEGPPHPFRKDGRRLTLELRLRVDAAAGRADLRVGGKRVRLEPGRYSDWIELRFPLLPGISVRGVCRFRLNSADPLEIYVTPINVDPARPSLPVSHPFIFSVFLSKLIGRYATLGLAEDTTALNDGVLDEQAFLDQAQLFHREREAMFFQMLRRYRRGLCACVFDITDRVQHMFMAEREQPQSAHAGAIEELYVQMDRMLARVMKEVDIDDERNALLVMSDHGFAPFRRGVHLNRWLQREGHLVLREGEHELGEYLRNVDWSRTRAFALGLSGIFLNLQGREASGVVSPADAGALRAELREGLLALRDPDTDEPPINEVFDTHATYDGPFLDSAPDLLVGYNRGYRASWETAKGSAGPEVVMDNDRHWTGDHCMDPAQVPGVLLCSRPLDEKRAREARLTDLGPTVLELFGIPTPRNMTGSALGGAAQ